MWMSDATKGMPQHTKYASARVELERESHSPFHFPLWVCDGRSGSERRKRLVLTKRLLLNRKTLDMMTRCWEQSNIWDKHHVNKLRHFYRRKFKMERLKREFPRYRQARGNAINNEMCADTWNPFCIFFLLIKYFDILLTMFNTPTVERLGRRRLNKH